MLLRLTVLAIWMAMSVTVPSRPALAQTQSLGSQCQFAIAQVLMRPVSDLTIARAGDAETEVNYHRQSDASDWTAVCKRTGDKLVWAAKHDGQQGRWRDHPTDRQIEITKGGFAKIANAKFIPTASTPSSYQAKEPAMAFAAITLKEAGLIPASAVMLVAAFVDSLETIGGTDEQLLGCAYTASQMMRNEAILLPELTFGIEECLPRASESLKAGSGLGDALGSALLTERLAARSSLLQITEVERQLSPTSSRTYSRVYAAMKRGEEILASDTK